jgi:hypothetical protein
VGLGRLHTWYLIAAIALLVWCCGSWVQLLQVVLRVGYGRRYGVAGFGNDEGWDGTGLL